MALQRQQRLSKKQKRSTRQMRDDTVITLTTDNKPGFTMKNNIRPMTENQKIAFTTWDEGYNLMLHGIAGTGKTFLGLYFSLKETMNQDTPYKKVYIIRSAVATRDQGFMPGSLKDKQRVFEAPYVPICTKMFGRGDAYEILKSKGLIEFTTTSYLRGETFEDCIVLVDEVQNMSDGELHTVMTRVGENCRIIFCGDIKQDDLTSERKKEMSGLRDFMRIIDKMSQFEFVKFQVEDIVRSALVKSYIVTRDKLGL